MNIIDLDIDIIEDEKLYKILYEYKIKHSCSVIDFECLRNKLKKAQQSYYIDDENKHKNNKKYRRNN